MPAIKITKAAVDKLKPEAKRVVYTDTDLRGFAIRVEPSGVKVYIYRYREAPGGRGAKERTLIIGRHGAFSPDEARRKADAVRYEVQIEEKSPAAEKQAKREEAGATVAVVGGEWLKHVDGRLKPNSVAAYRVALESHILPRIGNRVLKTVARKDVQKLYDDVAAEAPAAANRMIASLSALWSFAERRGYVGEDQPAPTRRIEKVKGGTRDRALTAAEYGRLGEALRLGEGEGFAPVRKSDSKHFPAGQRTKLEPAAVGAVRLLALTGCRLREMLELEWSEVDLLAGVIRLPVERSKTGARVVPLGDPAVVLLAGMAKGGRFVFGGRADIKRPWRAVARAAGLDWLTPHGLRHSFVTAASSAGVGYAETADVVGHSLPGVTARYRHVAVEERRKAATAIASWVDAAMQGEG